MKKQKILFNIVNIKGWMGGVYYAKNIINLFLHSDTLKKKFEIHLLTCPNYSSIFSELKDEIIIYEYDAGYYYLNSLIFIKYIRRNRIDYWYALSMNLVERLEKRKAILWIADFQYIHFPNFFSKREWWMRNAIARFFARQKNILIFSSNDAKTDFEKNYPKFKCRCNVVHFTSDILFEVNLLNRDKEKIVLEKYGLLNKQYIYIPNQFWQHKNHLIVLKVIEMMSSIIKEKNIVFVFTGQMSDYRNNIYIEQLTNWINKDTIKKYILNLGFIERLDQIVVMKNAEFLIQPSLFEGWGTVLEDAKVLDKNVILSDISVHKEQMYDKCLLFAKDDPNDLMTKVVEMLNRNEQDSVKNGIERFESDSVIYARELEKALGTL